jgi:hypothetical protein
MHAHRRGHVGGRFLVTAAPRRQQGAFVSIDSDLEICRIAAKKR